jgi:hypothetical protein
MGDIYSVAFLPTDLEHKLTPYHSKHPHLYGLPKIHKLYISLKPIVSSICSPCYALAGFLHRILSPLAGNSESFVKNSAYFVHLLKAVSPQSEGTFVSFDVVSLFTNVPIENPYKSSKISSTSMTHTDGTRGDLLEIHAFSG